MLRTCIAAAVAAALLLAPFHAPAGTPLGADSPQAVVARANQASARGDIVELTACLEPESRMQMAVAMLAGATLMIAFMDMGTEMAAGMAKGLAEGDRQAQAKVEQGKAQAAERVAQAKAALSAVFKKHGLPDLLDDQAGLPQGDPKAALAKVDQPALIGDLMRVIETIGDKSTPKDKPAGEMAVPKEVTDYRVDGDHATAQGGGETLQFVKVDGRWFLKPADKKKDGGAPAAK